MNSVLLGYYATINVNSFEKLRDNLSLSSPLVKNTKINSGQA